MFTTTVKCFSIELTLFNCFEFRLENVQDQCPLVPLAVSNIHAFSILGTLTPAHCIRGLPFTTSKVPPQAPNCY